MRIQPMDVQHGHVRIPCVVTPFLIVRSINLYARSAVTFDAMASAADQKEALGIGRAIERDIHRQCLALSAFQWVREGLYGHTHRVSRIEKLGSRRCIVG